MAAQRNGSLTPSRLTSIMVTAALLCPALSLDSLRCYFCPLQPKEQSCPNVTTHCTPAQRCTTSTAYYGAYHALSSQGCVDAELCGARQTVTYKGVEFRVRHRCCCRDKCNMAPGSKAILKLLLGMTAEQAEYSNITHALREQLWGSCSNDPSTSTSSPAS
uniref:sperm acrosome membrane-associated protein 4-like n=1 Tax=Doryrhamphus excisus TaxID=161450 RepID=UPI0025AE85DB|nr:sperm acrosome membrane-associated protein 4-like [Doryrhamphus excisus]